MRSFSLLMFASILPNQIVNTRSSSEAVAKFVLYDIFHLSHTEPSFSAFDGNREALKGCLLDIEGAIRPIVGVNEGFDLVKRSVDYLCRCGCRRLKVKESILI